MFGSNKPIIQPKQKHCLCGLTRSDPSALLPFFFQFFFNFDPDFCFKIMKMNMFRDDLNGILAKKAPLPVRSLLQNSQHNSTIARLRTQTLWLFIELARATKACFLGVMNLWEVYRREGCNVIAPTNHKSRKPSRFTFNAKRARNTTGARNPGHLADKHSSYLLQGSQGFIFLALLYRIMNLNL